MVTFADVAQALGPILRGEVRCTVFAIERRNAASVHAGIRSLNGAVPSHPIIAWYDRSLSSHDIVETVKAGAFELVIKDSEDSRHEFGPKLESAMQRSHVRAILDRIEPNIPDFLFPVFKFAVERAHQKLDVNKVAAIFGITRQTLRNRLRTHGLPLPGRFINWCKLLVASSLLQESGHTLHTVGLRLEFESGHHLGTIMKRYVGVNVSDLRKFGIYQTVESAFLAEIGARVATAGG